jgi:LysR family glycine cleavage system transcriptional activator
MRSSPNLPPLTTLRVFEAVGRLRNFRRAGEELLITQSAVSHHIRKLEDALGLTLFIRHAKSIELTDEGLSYLEMVHRIFAEIAASTSRLRSRSTRKSIRVSLLPSFAANWLVGRLGRFHDTHPDIDVDLDPTLDHASPTSVDLCIRFGMGHWDNVEATLLVEERFTPVVHPSLLPGGTRLAAADGLAAFPLLLTRNPFDWEIWARCAGMDLRKARQIQLIDYNIALGAAVAQQGVAIGRAMMIADHLSKGQLVLATDMVATASGVGYWVVTAPGLALADPVNSFIAWLKEECATAMRETCRHLPSPMAL